MTAAKALFLIKRPNMKLKTLKAHPNSPLARMMPKILEDQKWQMAYCRGEISREELEAKGVKLVNPIQFN